MCAPPLHGYVRELHYIFPLLGFGGSGMGSLDEVPVHMPRHLEGKRQEDVSHACAPHDVCIMGGGQSYLTPMSLTNQPAVPIHVLFKLSWDAALTVDEAVMAGSWVFGTDVPYEALGIGYHLDID